MVHVEQERERDAIIQFFALPCRHVHREAVQLQRQNLWKFVELGPFERLGLLVAARALVSIVSFQSLRFQVAENGFFN
jgi:hypothetical protein